MEEAQAFAKSLEERLDAKRDSLDRDELPKMKETWKLFQTAFQGLYGVLFKKGIVHEDPYKYELKISEVTTPPEGPFAESEKLDQMSLRLSQFESYLDFLNNYYQFSVDFLTMGRIKRLLGLVKYFNFTQFSDTSNQLNTRCLAELVGMVKRGSDQLSSGLIAESASQLDKASRDILAALKELASYHRERYKLELRQLVMPSLSLDSAQAITHRDEALRQVRRKFSELAGDRPFYAELAEEVLMEDHSSDGPQLRDELLRRLEVKSEKKTEKAKEKSYKGVVLDAVRILAGINYPLEDAVQKMSDNSSVLESRNTGFLQRLKAAIRNVFSPQDKGIAYEVEILDAVTGTRTTESIDIAAFVEEGTKKAKQLAGLLQRGGPGWRRLETAPEELSFKFLERTMEELQRLVKRIAALDEYFKSATPAEDRPKLRGAKAEITTIKGALIKANQKKHEYVAQKEELEQMRRLGIRAE
ncbi:MAG TPA: hypothetical protein PLG14_01920 [Spirochaetales bacterium]|nr:hypothetical protein [Spirochaetales bacterium]